MNGLLAEAKVSEDNMTLAIQHDILWLQIPTQCYMIKSMEQEMEGKISLKLEGNVTQNGGKCNMYRSCVNTEL